MAQARAATARSAHLAATVEASVGLETRRPLYEGKAVTPQWKGQWVPPSQSRWELPGWEGPEGHGTLPTEEVWESHQRKPAGKSRLEVTG